MIDKKKLIVVLLIYIMLVIYIDSLHITQDAIQQQRQQHHHHHHLHSNTTNNNKHIKQSVIDAIKLYHNDKQIQHIINNLTKSYPSLINKYQCENDPNYSYLTIDNNNNLNNLNDDSNDDLLQQQKEQKKQVVITCNIHARELLTTEVCLQFIKKILNSQSNLLPQQNKLSSQTRITIFYRGNDQRDNVINGKDYCIRKDTNNIDINRNFPTNFNHYHQEQQHQQYPGPQPLTQPFSKCLDNYLYQINQTNQINTYIDIHTGQFTLFDSFQSEDNSTYVLLQNVKQKYCPQCRITSLGTQLDNDIANGQIFTDIKKRYNAKHSVLFQIYGGYNDNLNNQQNCIAIFNPLTQQQLNYYKQIWTNALQYFILQSLKTQSK